MSAFSLFVLSIFYCFFYTFKSKLDGLLDIVSSTFHPIYEAKNIVKNWAVVQISSDKLIHKNMPLRLTCKNPSFAKGPWHVQPAINGDWEWVNQLILMNLFPWQTIEWTERDRTARDWLTDWLAFYDWWPIKYCVFNSFLFFHTEMNDYFWPDVNHNMSDWFSPSPLHDSLCATQNRDVDTWFA
jgi:hypothetical protein